MIIAIPSYKRAKNLITSKWLPSAIVVVPESQEAEYKEHNPDTKIVSIPDNQDGNVSKKRNAILNMYEGENVVLMDDDVEWVGYHEDEIHHKVNESYFIEFAENMFLMAEEMGTILWGVNLLIDPRMYREYTPFSMTNVVLGPLSGFRNVDKSIRYDEEIFMKEDYDICIQVLRKYRRILRNNKWVYLCGHIHNAGGFAGIRNEDNEREHALAFQKKWGSAIVNLTRKTQGGNVTINPRVRVPIKGV